MRSLTPDELSLGYRCFGWRGQKRLALAATAFFDLTVSGHAGLLDASEQWDCIEECLAEDEIYDLGYPKPRGEGLVYGSCFAPQGKPAHQGYTGDVHQRAQPNI